MGADRRHVGRARHQHAHRRILRPPTALRPALFRTRLRPAPHGLLAAGLLRLFACAAAAFAPGRREQLLHHQGQLVGDEQDAVRPVLVGGPRWQPRAGAHLRQPGRRLQRPRSAARRSRNLAQLPRQDTSQREPAVVRLRRRRRRPDRGDDRAPAADGGLPCDACDAAGERRGLVRRSARVPGDGRTADMGRRDVSRTPSRHADDAGPHQVPAPACRTRAHRCRGAVEHGRAAR